MTQENTTTNTNHLHNTPRHYSCPTNAFCCKGCRLWMCSFAQRVKTWCTCTSVLSKTPLKTKDVGTTTLAFQMSDIHDTASMENNTTARPTLRAMDYRDL